MSTRSAWHVRRVRRRAPSSVRRPPDSRHPLDRRHAAQSAVGKRFDLGRYGYLTARRGGQVPATSPVLGGPVGLLLPRLRRSHAKFVRLGDRSASRTTRSRLAKPLLCLAGEVSHMTTSRVPGVTRNSGWRAVDALIHESRSSRSQQTETSTEGESRAEGWTRQNYGVVRR